MPSHPSQGEPLKRLMKIVSSFLTRPDVGPFREPVDWRGLGLDDYPKIVKTMMDLGTVKRKLERKQYFTATECADDIRLIWHNCMAYNADGSDFWLLAKSFARRFEDRYRKIRQEVDCGADLKLGDEGPRETTSSSKPTSSTKHSSGGGSAKEQAPPPSAIATSVGASSASSPPLPLDTRTRFGANLFLLSGVELARVIMKLEQECPHVLEQMTEGGEVDAEKAVSPKLEINIDAIESSLFDELSAYVLERVGSKGHSDAKMDHVSSSASASSRPKKKKKT